MNNEDINNLEEIINLCKEEVNNNDKNITATLDLEDLKSLKNLLTRYKQLEEENKSKQKAYDDCYCEYKHYKQFDSIPTSLIKEKIEELEELVKDFEEYWSKDPRKFKKEKCIDYYKLEALQELLGEE